MQLAKKRGRPLSEDSGSQAINEQRRKDRERMRRRREEQKVQHATSASHVEDELQLGERIITFSPIEEESASHTLAHVGLRVQNLTLAQDVGDVQLQEEAQSVDERDTLYPRVGLEQNNIGDRRVSTGFFRRFITPRNNLAETEPEGSQQRRPGLSQHFRTVPPPNPFVTHDTPTTNQEQGSVPNEDDGSAMPIHGGDDSAESSGSIVDNSSGVRRMTETTLRGSEDQLVESSSEEEGDAAPEPGDDGESFHDFASAHSAHSDDDNDNEQNEISAIDYIAQKLYEQLVEKFHGCSAEEHAEQLRKHMETAGNNHHSLNEIFNDPDFPSVLGLSEMISPERLARQEAPSASQWSSMFCGVSRRHPTPMNVCLHKEETQEMISHVVYDEDSFMGFSPSLGVLRKGLWVQPVPQMRQNMTADNHINTNVFQVGDDPEQPIRSSSVMLRDVPHFLLGRVVGAHDITMHVLFPYMGTANEKFVSLTKEQMTRWLDLIFLPALHTHYDPHYTQYFPASFRHAFANSKAQQVENRRVETASYQAQQAIGYHLQPESLDAMWSTMLDTIATTPGLADFRDPQLFFSAKGTKLQFKTSPSGSRKSLLDAMLHFESFFEDVFDSTLLDPDRVYVDIGKEICPQVSLLVNQEQHVGDEPQVYLPRRCCLEEYMRWMYDGQPPKKGGRGQQYFHINMLSDATSLTSVTPKRSKQREAGLIYTQVYTPVKGILEATKYFLFNNEGMEEMALDPQIRNGARQAAGGRRREAKVVEQAHLASKRRGTAALKDSAKKSFSHREEHRVTWRLFQRLKRLLQHHDGGDSDVELRDCPTHIWPVRSNVYMDFLWRSADKFATGFEVIRARCHNEFVTWEQTKMMIMFLRCLRFVFGGHLLSRESALWWSRRERTIGDPPRVRTWYGLGFGNTLPRYGYGWLEPRFDWDRLQFKSDVTDQILFGNSVLRGQYLRRGGQVQAFFDTTRRLELAIEWLGLHWESEVIRTRMIKWVVHICLQQFRVDVLSCVKGEMVAEHREEAMEGKSPFCYEWLDEIMTDGVHLMSGNRLGFKVASHLGRFLFQFDDGRLREHWEDRPFRKLYRRALAGVGLRGRQVQQSFLGEFWRSLFQYHWILPYPCENALMQTTKQGRRMWYSIRTSDDIEAWVAEEKDWEWARKDWKIGRPRRLPQWLDWGKEEWEQWIEERG